MNKSVQQRPVVLVVDDSPDDMLLLHTAAQEVCPEVSFIFKGSAEAALAYLNEKAATPKAPAAGLPNLVLLDYRLTTMDSLGFLRRLRATPDLTKLKVLVWTGALDPKIKHLATKAGADGFLPKAPSFPQLVKDVRHICEQAGIPEALIAPRAEGL